MISHPFRNAAWIARPVPAAQRTIRHMVRDRIDEAAPGESLSQSFRADGPVTAVSLDVAAPQDVADPFVADVKFTIELRSEGRLIAEKVVEGPQLLWERFGQLLELDQPAAPGQYTVSLTSERGTIGWFVGEELSTNGDDGVSPLPVIGEARWNGAPVPGVRLIGIETIPAPNPWFRQNLFIDGPVREATLAAVVLGCGVVRVNGRRVGEEALEPAVTDYDRTVLYRTWDVAHLLRAGENEVLVEAGRERFAARGGDIWGWHLAPWHREPMALVCIDVTYDDGRKSSLVSDDRWVTAAGPVERELLFGGEDWVVPAQDPSWEPVTKVEPPSGVLRPAKHAPIVAGAPMPPITSVLVGSGTVHDFGVVMTGRIRCRVTGKAGGSVTVRSGEQLDASGCVICENTLAIGEAQRDTLRLERDVEGFDWEPQFSYRGYRWMQVDTAGDVRVEQVRSIPLYTPVESLGALQVSDPLVEWIDSALATTFRNNLHGIPTDTPIYEKNGWTADAHLATEGLLHHFDLRGPFGKWMDDHVDSQSPNGSIPQIVPTPGWGRASDPAWSASAVLIPWYLYREYGDVEILSRYVPMITRFAEHLITRSGGALWPDRSWSDWLPPGYSVGPEGMAPVGTAMTVTVLQHTARILRALGRGDADQYDSEATRLAGVYHAAYFDASRRYYRVEGVGYRQVLNILPLSFDIVPTEYVSDVRRSLIDDIEGRTGGHLDCGAIGVRHLLPVLTDAGRDDLAVSVLTRRTRPGWGAWFEAGERTMMENWDADARSRNHYFLGSVASWIQQRVGGLRLTEPGWTGIEVSPVRDDRITGARISHDTPLGRAAVDWRRGPGGWDLRVHVPKGAKATVVLPGVRQELEEGEHQLRVGDQSHAT